MIIPRRNPVITLRINPLFIPTQEKPCVYTNSGVCLTGVGSTNAILCDGCEHWVHKKCSGIKGRLPPESDFRCARCLGTARAIDERQSLEVEVGNEKLKVVPEFCYLGDMLSAGGGCNHTLQMCMGQVPAIGLIRKIQTLKLFVPRNLKFHTYSDPHSTKKC